MPNVTITNVDTGSVLIDGRAFEDGVLQNADAEDPATFAEGTILARHSGDLKFYPFDPAGENALDVPVAVLTYPVEAVAAASGVSVRVCTAGDVNKNRLVIHDETPLTAAHLDALRDYGIVPVDVHQLGKLDNPG